MSDELQDDLSQDEREALRSLGRAPRPPQALEERTVEALRERGLIAPGADIRRRSFRRAAPWLLAAAALYILGVGTGWRLAAPAAPAGLSSPESPEFILLLHQAPDEVASLSEQEHSRRVGEYVAWARRLAETGTLVGGHELGDSGRVLTGSPAALQVASGPRPGGAMVVGGYFLIRARDYADAVRTSSDCPHLKYGGEIEIRQVDPT